MRGQRLMFVVLAAALAGSITFAQPGRGGSQWLTALADAQRTSWVRSDDKISVAALSKPGFELQWKVKLDNQPRGVHGLAQGVTASGVTLFVPMSVVAGSSNNVYGIDNDLGYVVWQRHFDAALPAATAACAGGITSAATRIVRLDSPTAAGAAGFGGGRGRGVVGYRSLLGEPGEGVPAEGRAAGPGRAGDPSGAPAPAGGRGTPAGRRAGRRSRRGTGARRASRLPRRVRPSSAFPARRGRKRMPALTLSCSGPPVSAMSCRATACCTCSVLRPARTSSARRAFLPANCEVVRARGGGHDALRGDIGQVRRRAGRRVGDRSGQRREAGRVVEDERRGSGRGRRVHAGRHAHRGDRSRAGDRRRQGERDRRARPEDAAGEGLVLAADGGIRHRPDDPPAQQQEHRGRGDEGRTRPAAGLRRRSADRITPRRSLRRSRSSARAPPWAAMPSRHGRSRARHVVDSAPGQGAAGRGNRDCQRAGLGRRRGCAEAGGRGRRALARAGLGLARPLLAGHTAHRQRRRLHACDRHALNGNGTRQLPPFFTPTKARPASGCGTAARR